MTVVQFHGSLGEYKAADDVPTEFRLLKAGINEYNDGDEILFDDEAAASVLQRYQKRGVDLTADYEHQSLQVPPIIAPASAKRWVPEVRDGALMASHIAWTDKARSMIAAGEYRYFSIAALVDAKTKRIRQLINFALTNNPAANNIAPLMAARHVVDDAPEPPTPPVIEPKPEGMPMSENVIMALGLKADADEATAVVEASTLAGMKRELLEITKAKSVADALGTMRAFASSQQQLLAVQARLHAIEVEKRKAEFDGLMKQPDVLAKLTPALQKSEWLQGLRDRDDGPAQLRSFLAAAPVFIPPQEEQATVESVDLTDEEYRVAKTFAPDPVALEARLKSLKEQKLKDLQNRAARRR